MKSIDSKTWMNEFSADDKVLLINPPVQEVRYAWVRWNQPSDLLLLSSKLKAEVGCDVQLLDFMLPNEAGRVPMRDLAKLIPIRRPGKQPFHYKARTYGAPIDEVKKTLENILPNWTPTHIVFTTLTSYWFQTIKILIPYLRTVIPSVKISLIGAYPVIETDHAYRLQADLLVTDFIDFADYLPDFDIYFREAITKELHNGRTISFGGLKYTKTKVADNLIRQVKKLKEHGIRDFVIFEGNLFIDGCSVMSEFMNLLEREGIKINLHGLCGLEISDAVDGIYHQMYQGGYRSFFLEYDLDTNQKDLNLDSYRRAYFELRANDTVRISSGNLAGFIKIGRREDDLERIFTHSFNLLEICGSIIPKPHTPNPWGDEKEVYSEIARKQGLEYLSPHVFPLAETNGISREEYLDLYKHTTFLNEKRMGKSFDFFDKTYSSEALKRSLGKKGGTF